MDTALDRTDYNETCEKNIRKAIQATLGHNSNLISTNFGFLFCVETLKGLI